MPVPGSEFVAVAVAALREASDAGKAAKTIRSIMSAVRSWCRYADIDPTRLAEYRLPPVPEPNPKPLSGGLATVAQMIRDAPTDAVRTGLVLMGACGLRIAEAAAVTPENLHGGAVTLVGKGGRRRTVPVPATYLPLLETRARKVGPGNPLVGARLAGTRALFEEVVIAGMRAGDDDVHPHRLRATFLTAVYEQAHDLHAVRVLAGHSSVVTSSHYVRSDVDAAVDLVDALMREA